jgi:putative ABC transport system permease protein
MAVAHSLHFPLRDTALVVRRLLRAPVFAVVAVATLTLGLGMFAVVYTAVEKILVAPMPYPNPDDLYFVWRDYGPVEDRPRGGLPGTDVAELQNAGGVIEHAVAMQPFLGGVFAAPGAEDPMEASVIVTSPGLFELLGVTPALGRGFTEDDAGPGKPFTIVLTHELWATLGADRGILGTDVLLNGRPHTVIGVLPQGFDFVRNDADGLPQRAQAFANLRVNITDPSPNQSDYSALIRARAGTPPEAVAAAVDAVGRIVDARDFQGRGVKLYSVGLKADLVARVRSALLTLAAAGALLALMLMVNLASVLLARTAQREHELAVSRALGADGGTVARGTLLEGGLLGLAGGAFGAVLGVWGTRALVALAPLDLPRTASLVFDWSDAAVVVCIGALLGVVAAVAPAIWAARSSLSALLASSAVRGGGDHGRLRRGMIVAQVALSLVVLNSGALVVRSLEQLLQADPGFRSEGVYTVRVRTPPVFFQSDEVVPFQDRVTAAMAGVPGVSRVSAATVLPLTANNQYSPRIITVPGAPGNTGDAAQDAVLTDVIGTRAGYFEVMSMRLVAGRTFEESPPRGTREAVIDTAFARRFFPGTDPLGATIRLSEDDSFTVVGVVQQARLFDIHLDGRPQLYAKMGDGVFFRALFYVIATTREPAALLPELRAAVRNVDPRVAVGDARSMDEIVGNALRQQRTGATLISAFALGALLLAAMGIFGVVAGAVARRHHELAVRLAVGAEHRNVLRLIVREATLLVGIGVLIGVPGVYAASGLVRGALVGVSPSDPRTLAGVVVGLALVTLATGYAAARRVLAIDPAELLRSD